MASAFGEERREAGDHRGANRGIWKEMDDARHRIPNNRFLLTRRENMWHLSTNFGWEREVTHRRAVVQFRKENIPQNTYHPLLYEFENRTTRAMGPKLTCLKKRREGETIEQQW
jgi:hypothetical protein